MINRVARHLVIGLVLSAVAVDSGWAATCCVSSAGMCSATPCQIPNVGGNCPIAAFSEDCGAPHYCSFDSALGCQTTNPCTAAKLKAIGQVARHALTCHAKADAWGLAVDPACTSNALGALVAAFTKADLLGSCAGGVTTLQNDIGLLAGTVNTVVGNATEPRTPSKCDAKKVVAVGTLTNHMLAAMSRAARTANSPFPGILSADRRALRAARGGAGCSSSAGRNELEDDAAYPFLATVADHLATP